VQLIVIGCFKAVGQCCCCCCGFVWCRIGDIGRLMVQRVSDAGPGTFELAESYPTHSRIALTHDMDLFIGGLPDGYHVRYHRISAVDFAVRFRVCATAYSTVWSGI